MIVVESAIGVIGLVGRKGRRGFEEQIGDQGTPGIKNQHSDMKPQSVEDSEDPRSPMSDINGLEITPLPLASEDLLLFVFVPFEELLIELRILVVVRPFAQPDKPPVLLQEHA